MRVEVDGSTLYVEEVADPARITQVLAEQGLFVRELVPERADLESVFLELTDKARTSSRESSGGTAPAGGTS
jgi:ABC-2 type transport system ATP-binding protein